MLKNFLHKNVGIGKYNNMSSQNIVVSELQAVKTAKFRFHLNVGVA